MKPVANLVIEMAANVARLEKDMQSARRSVDGAMQKIQRSAQMAMRALGALGLGLGAAQLTSFVKGAIDAGDRMQKLSQQTGIATQNIAGLQLAFRQGGGTAADMEMAINRLVIGMDKQSASFKKLNIQSTDTFGALSEISDIFQKLPDGAEKSALANELFGRSGSRLIPILNQGSAGLQKYIELSNRLGTSVTPEVARQFEKYNDTMDTVGAAMEGLAMQAATALVPALQAVADALINLFESGAVKRGIDGLVMAFQLLAVVMATKVVGAIAGVVGRTAAMTAGMTVATGATAGLTVAMTALRGVMAFLGGPVGVVVTVAAALVYFTEKSYDAANSAEALATELGIANGELQTMNATQIESKLIQIAIELNDLAIAASEAAAELDNLNNQMLDPEAYAIKGGQNSSALAKINRQIQIRQELLEKLKGQLVQNADSEANLNGITVTATEGTKDQINALRELIAAYEQQTVALTLSSTEKDYAIFLQKLENEGVREGTKLYKELTAAKRDAISRREIVESALAQKEAEEKVAEERVKVRLEAEKEFQREAEMINNQIGQSLTDALVNGGQSAKDFISNMFKTLILRPVLQPIISGVLGAVGVGAAGAALAGTPGATAGGGADAFGIASALKSAFDVVSGGFTAVGTAASGLASSMLGADAAALAFMEGTGATATAAAGQLSSISATAAAVGAAATVLAGVAAGLAAGSFISGEFSLFGGNQMIATAAGTAIGTAIGFAVGGPIGGAIGALIGGAGGGLVNRAFGRGPKETQAAGITGTLNVLGGELQAFNDWRQKGGWFRSSKTGTQLTQLDVELSNFFAGSTQAIGASVSILANSIGQSADNIGQFSQQIRLDLLNLSDEEAQARISEALSDFSNNLVNFVVPSIQFMAKSGETATETLTRLSSSLLSVNRAFSMLDIKVFDLSLNSAQAASNLVDLTGGIDGFTQKIDFFYQNFLSAQDRANLLTAQATEVFNQLGIAMPTTRDGFKQLFDVIAGSGSASLTAALLNIAPVINEVIGFTEQLEQANRQVSDAIRNERLGLENQILQVLGDTVTIRERELSSLDESNRALQERIYALTDEKEAIEKQNQIDREMEAARIDSAIQTLSVLESVFNESKTIEAQILQLVGNTVEIRSRELNALNPLNRGLQEMVYRLQDAQTALQDFLNQTISNIGQQIGQSTQAANQARNAAAAYRDVNKSLKEAAESIFFSTQPSGNARQAFTSALSSAQGGDLSAMQALPQLAISLQDVEREQAKSSVDFAIRSAKIANELTQVAAVADVLGLGADYQAQLLDVNTAILETIRADLQSGNATVDSIKEQTKALLQVGALLLSSQSLATQVYENESGLIRNVLIDTNGNVIGSLDSGTSLNLQALAGQNQQFTNSITGQTATFSGLSQEQVEKLMDLESTTKLQNDLTALVSYATEGNETLTKAVLSVLSTGTKIIGLESLVSGNGAIVGQLSEIRLLIQAQNVASAAAAAAAIAKDKADQAAQAAALADLIKMEEAALAAERTRLANEQARIDAERKADEARRIAEQKVAAEARAAAEAKAAKEAADLAEAQRQAQARADAESAAAEERRIAAAKAKADADARAADAAAAEAARLEAIEERKRQSFNELFGDFFGSGSAPFVDPNVDPDGNVIANKDGGRFAGGLSLVGEEGPEMVNFARPSMIYTAGETAEILNGGSKNGDVAYEVRQLRQENQAQSRAMVSLQARMTRLIERWDGDGLPEERYEDATA